MPKKDCERLRGQLLWLSYLEMINPTVIFAEGMISGILFMDLTKERFKEFGIEISPVGLYTIRALQKEMNPTPGGILTT